jgi:inorganic triphosphatase YgiF
MNRIDRTKYPQEIEVKLVIASEKPDQLARRISSMDQIMDFELTDPAILKIRDVYFDTPKANLGKNRLSLRCRFVGSDCLITLKGKTELKSWGGIQRLEIEKQCSKASLESIRDKLKALGVTLADGLVVYSMENPLKSMQNMGLQVIQDRRTLRHSRSIISSAKSKRLLGEISVDRVTYLYSAIRIIHHEIEIEAKGNDGIKAVQRIAQQLKNQLPQELRFESFSKLTLGILLEKFSDKNNILPYLDQFGQLLPSAYDWISTEAKIITE